MALLLTRHTFGDALAWVATSSMPEVSGIEEDTARGSAIAKRRGEIFTAQFLPNLRPFRDADRLVAAIKARVSHRGGGEFGQGRPS